MFFEFIGDQITKAKKHKVTASRVVKILQRVFCYSEISKINGQWTTDKSGGHQAVSIEFLVTNTLTRAIVCLLKDQFCNQVDIQTVEPVREKAT